MSQVTLLHGLGGSAHATWRVPGWVDILTEEGHDVTEPDLPGHGDAPRPLASDRARTFGVDLLPDPDGTSHVGVGFSLGAKVLIETASAHPDRFDGLVLMGLGDRVFEPWDPRWVIETLTTTGDPEHPFLAHLRDLVTDHGDPHLVADLLAARGDDSLHERGIAPIDCPVLIVIGDRDPVGPPDRLAAAFSDARVLTVSRCDHFGLTDRFEAIDAVVRFLE